MAARPSTVLPHPHTHPSLTAPKISPEIDPLYASKTLAAFQIWGLNESLPQTSHANGFFSKFIRSFINVDRVERGRIICTISIKPPISNYFGTLHGGGLASVAEVISIACARTVVPGDKQIFLGEMSMSYLSGAPVTAEVIADAYVVKSGRNLTVVLLEFKLKKTEKLIYKSHATFYNYPVAKL
ncbi:acyl-coenzyme A thioesterase 13-like [Neltuma alba]|uniref:acyl-coenzyme A thioesterase 13-like n=1 Tax=Neltuma alba TaxID=207710 RepID=UPI0010A57E72|nr:acyl-coenzyme A thioesterase 13-like [Prosopis alba]XP_028784283.1 acyl-coenzyme A thioesterase 13-like [Prosopis alba]